MHKMSIVNTNWLLDAMWYIIKKFNAKKTVEKIDLFKTGSEVVLTELLLEIEAKYIPTKLGGELEL